MYLRAFMNETGCKEEIMSLRHREKAFNTHTNLFGRR